MNPTPEHQPFTRDIYPGLDETLDSAYHPTTEVSPGPTLPVNGLDAVVQDAVNAEGEMRHPLTWAYDKLGDAFDMLDMYQMAHLPADLMEMDMAGHSKNVLGKIAKLHEAWTKLDDIDGLETSDGMRLADAMGLFILPWQAMRDNIANLQEWVVEMWQQHNPALRDDLLDLRHVDTSILGDLPIYRNPDKSYTYLSPRDYLDHKIETDGAFGLLLAQVPTHTGLKQCECKSLRTLFRESQEVSVKLGDVAVDAMGVFEWLAISLHFGAVETVSVRPQLLLANQYFNDGDKVSNAYVSLREATIGFREVDMNKVLSDSDQHYLAVQ